MDHSPERTVGWWEDLEEGHNPADPSAVVPGDRIKQTCVYVCVCKQNAKSSGAGASANEPKTVHVPPIDKQVWNALLKRLLSVSVRAQVNKSNQTRLWTMELVFYGSPLPSLHHKEQGMRRAVYLQYEMQPVESVSKVVDQLLSDWSKIVYLYTLVHEFREQYNNEKYNLPSMVAMAACCRSCANFASKTAASRSRWTTSLRCRLR